MQQVELFTGISSVPSERTDIAARKIPGPLLKLTMEPRHARNVLKDKRVIDYSGLRR